MSTNGQEIEAKFYIRDLDKIRERLEDLNATLVQERVLETNIRFDLPDAHLRAEGRVLRLRRDTEARLTYKSASKSEQGVLSREEIEFVVGDFEKARQFLEALGYQKLVYYEKFRTTFELNETLIMLDELPYGDFVEIEGKNVDEVHLVARQLDLNPESAIATSYHSLFERACKSLNLLFEDPSFANFKNIQVEAGDLKVRAADV